MMKKPEKEITVRTTVVTNELKNKLIAQKNTYVAARSSKLQEGTAEKILNKIQEQFNLQDTGEALTILAILFQQGGTARSCDGNMNTVIFDREFKLADIRKILKQMSCNKSERKLARTLATEIYEVAVVMGIPGNLYSKIQKSDLNRSFTLEEQVWLSDFQSDNENCPTELRSLIIETFKKNKENSNKKKNNK